MLSCDSGGSPTDADGSSGAASSSSSSSSSGGVSGSSAGTATSSAESTSGAETSGGDSESTTEDDTTTSSSTDGSTDAASSSTGASTIECPDAPASLTRWQVGNDDDAQVDPTGPALILMGGGPDVDEAFAAAFPYAAGGDAVVLRASGSDGYNDYFLDDIGGLDSVETLLIDQPSLADDPYVACRVEQAEVVWFAGGDQAAYMEAFSGSAVAAAVDAVHARGGVVGGTSAGLAILGEHVFAAYEGTVYPDEVLEDPYNQYMTLDAGPFALPALARVITDSHFYERDRMARLVGFVARLVEDDVEPDALGVGIDEATALLIGPDAEGTVYGDGYVYVLAAAGLPQQCAPGMLLTYQDLPLWRLIAGDTVSLQPDVEASVEAGTVGASEGVIVPANPY